MKALSEKAKALKNAYQRQYRNNHPEKKAQNTVYHIAWRKQHPDKIKQYALNYWEKKASIFSIQDQEAKKLSNQGFTQREIARELNISLGKVNKILNKNEQ